MTDYLQLARERAAGAPPSDAANPYMGIAQENQRRQETQLRGIVERALKDDPELAAERQRLSFHHKPLRSDSLHLLLSREVPGNAELMQRFNRGLNQLRDSGKVSQYLLEIEQPLSLSH